MAQVGRLNGSFPPLCCRISRTFVNLSSFRERDDTAVSCEPWELRLASVLPKADASVGRQGVGSVNSLPLRDRPLPARIAARIWEFERSRLAS